jgi:oxalate decarboxylase
MHAQHAAGDLWYFPPNVPHSILGLAPSGCTYVSGYNAPDFNESRAFSASSWLATVPQATLAQVRLLLPLASKCCAA